MIKKISFLSFFLSLVCLGQTIPNFEGEYYFKDNKAMLYIFNKNKFLALGYETAVTGQIEIVDNKLEFKTDYPISKILLYGRNSSQRQIILDENTFRKGIYFTNGYNDKNDILLSEIKKEDYYCRSYCYYLPIEKKTDEFLFKSGEERNSLTSFKINKEYNEFLLKYIPADPEIFFLTGAFNIKDNQLVLSNKIQKKNLNLTEDIRHIIDKMNQIDLALEQDKIYLDEDFNLVFDKKIDLSLYTFNKSKNQYIKKTSNEKLNILYVYTKIKSEVMPNAKYKVDLTRFLDTKCLKTPKTILEEKKDKKREHEPITIEEEVIK